MIYFQTPWLLLLLPLAVLIFWLKQRDSGRVYFSDLKWLRLSVSKIYHPRMILNVLRCISFTMLVLALARPGIGKKFTQTESLGIDIFLIVDTSGSMQALDFSLNGQRVDRLEVTKKVAKDFVENRPYDRLGLVVFGQEAFTQCPLTLDHGVLVDFIDKTYIGMAGDATGIGNALGVAINRMKDIDAKSKVAILLTDGSNNVGELDPLKAAAVAKASGIKLYTIGVGSHGEVPFPVKTFLGTSIRYVRVELDEDVLKNMAQTTGGLYFRATDSTELSQIYAQIDEMEKRDILVKEYTQYTEIYFYFLWIGLFFLVAEIILGQTKLRKLP